MEGPTTRRLAVLIMALTSLSLVVQLTKSKPGTNPASRLATIESLVHRGTFVIDGASFSTIDKVRIDGRFYSSKPPLLSVVGAGVYAVLRPLGFDFGDPAGRSAAVYLLTLVLVGLPYALMLVFAARLLEDFAATDEARLWAFGALALASLPFGYAVTLNNHTPAAALLVMAFYFARRALHEGRRGDFAWVGFLGGLAPALDLGALFVSGALGLWLLWRARWRTLAYLVPVALVPVALHFVLTYLATDGLAPVYLKGDLYKYPGSYWNDPKGVDALDEPKLVYLANMLIGHHGLFALTPFLLLGAVAAGRAVVRRTRHRDEGLVVGGALLALVVFYTLTTKNYGGKCVGFRWLIIVMPLVTLFVADFVSDLAGEGSGLRRRLLSGLLVLSFVVSGYTAINALRQPWSRSDWHDGLAKVGLAPKPPGDD